MASALRRCTRLYLTLLLTLNVVSFLSGGKRSASQERQTDESNISYRQSDQDDSIPMFLSDDDAKSGSRTDATKVPITKAAPTKVTKATAVKTTQKPANVATTSQTQTKKAKDAGTVKPIKPTQAKTTKAKPTTVPPKATTNHKTEKATEKTTPKPSVPTPKRPIRTTAKVNVEPTKPHHVKTTAAPAEPTTKSARGGNEAKEESARCKKRWPWFGRVLSMTDCKVEYCSKAGKVAEYVLQPQSKRCTDLKHPALEIACPDRGKLYFHNHVVKYDPCSIYICSSGIPRELRKKNCKTNKPFQYL